MDANIILQNAKAKFDKALEHYQEELKKIRTGRAHPSMLDGVIVEVYGTSMPLIQVGSISTPESQLLQVTPFDPNNIQAICAAIREDQSLGLNPVDDGRVIRMQIPPLTTERRQQIAKQLGSKAEETAVRLRNARHEALKEAEATKKDKAMSEDDFKRFQKDLDNYMQQYKSKIDELTRAKESEILAV